MQDKVLSPSFFDQNTHAIAKGLLGKLLVRTWRNRQIVGRITETESYIGKNDKACHASKGKTERNKVMFGSPGHAYIYLIYGIYSCLNVVTEKEGFPAAALIRSLEPVREIDLMKRARKTKDIYNLTTGPGKLTQALHISKRLNGIGLNNESLFITNDNFKVSKIISTKRIGVDYAGKDALLPWRYYIANSKFVSYSK